MAARGAPHSAAVARGSLPQARWEWPFAEVASRVGPTPSSASGSHLARAASVATMALWVVNARMPLPEASTPRFGRGHSLRRTLLSIREVAASGTSGWLPVQPQPLPRKTENWSQPIQPDAPHSWRAACGFEPRPRPDVVTRSSFPACRRRVTDRQGIDLLPPAVERPEVEAAPESVPSAMARTPAVASAHRVRRPGPACTTRPRPRALRAPIRPASGPHAIVVAAPHQTADWPWSRHRTRVPRLMECFSAGCHCQAAACEAGPIRCGRTPVARRSGFDAVVAKAGRKARDTHRASRLPS